MNDLDLEAMITDGKGHLYRINTFRKPSDMTPLDYVLEKYLSKLDGTRDSETPAEAKPQLRLVNRTPNEPIDPKTIANIIAPFQDVILKDEVMNKVLGAVGLKSLIRAKKNGDNLLAQIVDEEIIFPNGVILNGPPGTGKSALMEAVGESFTRAGAHVQNVQSGQLEDMYVGSLAKNLSKVFDAAVKEARERGLPSLVIIDEASNLTTKVGGSSTTRYYQGALDTIKDYTTKYPEVVVMFATNSGLDNLDDALSRSKRLEVVTIDYPGEKEKARLLELFLRKFGVIEGLTDDQYTRLAMEVPDLQGADIRKFAEEYINNIIKEEHIRNGRSTVLDVIEYLFIEEVGADFTEEDVREQITFERVLADLRKFARNSSDDSTERRRIGFK